MNPETTRTDPDRLVVRLGRDDVRVLNHLISSTNARGASDVIRNALALFQQLWSLRSQKARIEVVRCDGMPGLTLAIGPAVSDSDDEPAIASAQIGVDGRMLQMRLSPEDHRRLSWLIDSHAGSSKSDIVRVAINLYHQIVTRIIEGCSLRASLSPEITLPIDVPGIEQSIVVSCENPREIQKRTPKELALPVSASIQSFIPGSRISLEEITRLHTAYMWDSVLVKIAQLYDNDEFFLPIVEKHLECGTKLFYVHFNPNVLDGLVRMLANRNAILWQKSRQLLSIIRVTKEDFDSFHHEMVVFDFLKEDGKAGFFWEPDANEGVVASSEDLEYLTREFRGKVADIEAQLDVLTTMTPFDRPLVFPSIS